MLSRAFPGMASSCRSPSATSTMGDMGGVIAILYARTADSAKCVSEVGESSHFVKSRTSDAPSWTLWAHSTPGPSIRRVGDVAEDHVHGHAIAVGVVDRHGRVLQAHGAMREYGQRLALDLGVAVGHADRRFLVAAGEELGIAIAAVVDHRFVQGAEAGAGIGADVLDAQDLSTSTMKSDPGRSLVRTSTLAAFRFRLRGRRRSGQ